MSDLTDRQHRLLVRLVAEYIEQGEPVSSAWLAENSGLGVSSATVRNILAHLEEQGLLRQPHTSAGRVPTDSGYRQYVEGLLNQRRRAKDPRQIETRLRQAGTVSDILDNASQELSRQSHHIGFALSAAPSAQLQHVDFVSLDARRVLVIVVSAGGHITHKVVETDEPHDAARLSEAANYINREFAGMSIDDARAAVARRLQEERVLYNALMSRALQLAQSGLNEISPTHNVSIQGTSAFLDGLSDRDERMTLETLRALFRMIEEKHRLLELLTRYVNTDGLTIVIGSEHEQPDMHPFSLVASTFNDGSRSATVGVIGPTRMRYQKTITVVDNLSKAVSRIL
ncbi:MAG: heat-inducible transcription repressor HrcA [Acidobacteria bacterium]|nr:MAG: heat-inducible transcription repressor HrcA [Acidobacteriota bacterium]